MRSLLRTALSSGASARIASLSPGAQPDRSVAPSAAALRPAAPRRRPATRQRTGTACSRARATGHVGRRRGASSAPTAAAPGRRRRTSGRPPGRRGRPCASRATARPGARRAARSRTRSPRATGRCRPPTSSGPLGRRVCRSTPATASGWTAWLRSAPAPPATVNRSPCPRSGGVRPSEAGTAAGRPGGVAEFGIEDRALAPVLRLRPVRRTSSHRCTLAARPRMRLSTVCGG